MLEIELVFKTNFAFHVSEAKFFCLIANEESGLWEHGLIQFELGEMLLSLRFAFLMGLLLFAQKAAPQNEDIHIGHQKTAPGVFGRADNGLASHIEAGVD